MHDDLEKILISPEQIQERIKQIAAEIASDYEGKDLVLICVLKGGFIFLSDLTRKITIKHSLDFIGASSYGARTSSSGDVKITKDVTNSIYQKHILLIEDIYDTGQTIKVIMDILQARHPASIELCTLLYKENKASNPIPIKYIGFTIPDVFVVGYGLDYNEYYRNLDYIGVLKEEIYKRVEELRSWRVKELELES